jgi:hypothetical protein
MRGSEYQSFLDIYVDNAKMLVGFDIENKVAARALLWDNVEMVTNGGIEEIKLMDRIYTAFDKDVLQLKKWAKDNGYAYKQEQNHHEKLNIVLGDKNVKAHLALTIPDMEKYKKFPYIDTFSYGLNKTNLLSNKAYSADSIEIKGARYYAPLCTYMNTNGWFSDNLESWDIGRDFCKRPHFILNLDYNKYIDWLNETFGYGFEKLDVEKIKENEASQKNLRNKRILEARSSAPTTIDTSDVAPIPTIDTPDVVAPVPTTATTPDAPVGEILDEMFEIDEAIHPQASRISRILSNSTYGALGTEGGERISYSEYRSMLDPYYEMLERNRGRNRNPYTSLGQTDTTESL